MKKKELIAEIQAAAVTVTQAITPRQPCIGLVLGSGLGSFADTLEDAVRISYDEIPGFAQSKVKGHAGQLVAGRMKTTKADKGADVLVMQGRVHCYEGISIEKVVLPVRTMIAIGCQYLIITNAVGGIRDDLKPGDLVLISDHLNVTGRNPLIGDNDDRLGPRFPDLSQAYDPELRELAQQAATEMGIDPLAEGVYSWMIGPSYETPADIQMLSRMGSDLVGMSMVPEVIAARHMGARVLGISCVTNMAAGLGDKLSHDEVKETAERVQSTFIDLLNRTIALIGEADL